MLKTLDSETRARAVASVDGWQFDPARSAIYRRLHLRSFAAALATMAEIGIVADRIDHHPEWTNVHDRIDILLTTHDAGGVGERDIDLARAIDAITARSQGKGACE